jgi:predicted RNA-binding Zn ribbon-like protein
VPVTLPSDRFARIGNNLSVDFVNTRYSPDHADGSLRSAKDVIDFLAATGALDPAQVARVRREVIARDKAERFFALALRLRSAVADALHAIGTRHALDPASLGVLNAILESDAGFSRLDHRRGARYELTYQRLHADARNALVPIARETARLLATPGVPVRKCPGAGCVRHFYDDSRTGRRRWCDMAICGNRAKAMAYTERHRAE